MQNAYLTLPVGTIIRDRYAIERLLGKGGYGSVYLVKDRRVKGNLFALKELIDSSKQERDRFTFEAEVLRRLDHPALPRVYRAFSDDANIRAYLLMDFIDGPNLEVLRLKQPEKRFPLARVLTIMKPIIEAISYLHDQHPPIIHRDVKPANIIVPITGDEAMLVDFGIAKEYEPASTTTTVRRCSPGYGAPEQYSSGTNTATDIYGLAATCYALLTGIVPADAFHRMIQLGSNAPDSLEPISKYVPDIPPSVAEAIQRAMSINVNSRFPTVEQFWQALNAHAVAAETSSSEEPMMVPVILASTASASSYREDVGDAEDKATREDSPASEPFRITSPEPLKENISSAEDMTIASERETVSSQSPAQFVAHQALLSSEKPAGSRKRRVGILPIFLVVLLLVGGSFAGLYWANSIRQPELNMLSLRQTAPVDGLKSTPGQKSSVSVTATITATSVTSQNVADIAGTYNGSMQNTATSQTSQISIMVQQQKGSPTISGQFTIKSHHTQTYAFTGTIDAQNNFAFTVQTSTNSVPLYFYGAIQQDQQGLFLHGDYCNSNTNHCSISTGYFNVGPRY